MGAVVGWVYAGQGKLDDDAGVEAVVMERRFFESHGFSGLEDLAVVAAKCGGLFRREDFLVGFADEILWGQMGNGFKLSVCLEIASGEVFDENQGWAMVHNRSEPFFAVP